ncbi:MAG: alkaline phosphatase family protein [Myxococcales bacterium]
MPTLADRLDLVDTLAVLMLENRSFDHLLGSLSLPGGGLPDTDGLRADPDYLERFANSGVPPFPWGGRPFLPSHDLPPHERDAVAAQLAGGAMTGFLDAWHRFPEGRGAPADAPPEPMGFLTASEAPVSHFLARRFAVCDRWFSALPASTQPNRLTALSGESLRDRTDEGPGALLGHQRLVFDWLEAHGPPVRWRVYHDGFPFLMLMPSQHERILFGPYRRLERLAADVAQEPNETFPQLLWIEPRFNGLFGPQNDNHPPHPLAFGEALLRQVYLALSGNPRRWARTLFVVTYDEHGGFFDHVAPPPIPTPRPAVAEPGHGPPFETLGVRVPALVVSPLVPPGPCHALFDHTSLLKLIAERFSLRERSLPALERRSADGRQRVASLSELPILEKPAAEAPMPPEVALPPALILERPVPEAHVEAALLLWHHDPERAAERFPELVAPFF